MICSSCKKEVNENLKYCPSCGTRLTLSKASSNNEFSRVYTMAEDLAIAKGKKPPRKEKEVQIFPGKLTGEDIPIPSSFLYPAAPPIPTPKFTKEEEEAYSTFSAPSSRIEKELEMPSLAETEKELEEKILPEETPVLIQPVFIKEKEIPEPPRPISPKPTPPPPPPTIPKPAPVAKTLAPKKTIFLPPIEKTVKKTISLPFEKIGFGEKHPYLVKGLAIALLVIIILGGSFYLFYKYYLKTETLSASFLPNDTVLLISFDAKSLSRGGDFAELSAKVSDKILTTSTWPHIFTSILETGLKLPSEKIGKEISFAIIRTNSENNEKDWISLIQTKNENVAKEIINQIQGEVGKDTRVKITPNNTALSQIKNFLVVSKREEINKKIFDVQEGKETSLSQNIGFQKAIKAENRNKLKLLFKENYLFSKKQKIGFYFLLPKSFSSLIEEKSFSIPWADSNALHETGNLFATENGLEIKSERATLPHKETLEKMNALVLSSFVPQNAAFYIEGKNLPILLDYLQEQEKNALIENIKEKFIQKGFVFGDEMKDFLRGEFAIFFTPHPETNDQNLSLIFKVKDVNQVKQKMTAAEPVILSVLPEIVGSEADSKIFQDNIHQNVNIRFIRFPLPSKGFNYTFIDDKFIISSSRESVHLLVDTIKNNKESIGFSENFKKASSLLGKEDFNYFFFINVEELNKTNKTPSIFSGLKFENTAGLFGKILSEKEKANIKGIVLTK